MSFRKREDKPSDKPKSILNFAQNILECQQLNLSFEFRLCDQLIKMHRAYQPITAANNKLLKKRWDQRSYDLHRSKVANSKSVIDNQPPDTYMHIHLKLKKLQVEEERLAVVERDNRILLEKMSWIMRTKGQVDNWNHYKQKSLNKCTRQRELLRVSHENQVNG